MDDNLDFPCNRIAKTTPYNFQLRTALHRKVSQKLRTTKYSYTF